MPRYIDAEHLMQKLSRMIDYCEKNKDKKFNALNVLFQVGDAIMDCPAADVAPKSEVERLERILNSYALQYGTVVDQQKVVEKAKTEVAREIFEEIDRMCIDTFGNFNHRVFAELKKKYTEGEE